MTVFYALIGSVILYGRK